MTAKAARDDYAKLDFSHSGPHHQGDTSRQAQAALDEIDRLRRWKVEASTVIGYWDDAFDRAQISGYLGELKPTLMLTEIEWLRAEAAAWKAVAVALMAEIADAYYDPNSVATLAYNHARNGRYVEAARLLEGKL